MRNPILPLVSSVALLVACSGALEGQGPGKIDTGSNLVVSAAVSGLTLGDEGCAATAGAPASRAPAADCAEPAPGMAPGSGCGGWVCRQSSVQIAITAEGSGAATKIEVVRVTLLESDDKELQDLAASSPRQWTEGGYAAFSGAVGAGANLKTMWSLEAPAWSKHGASYTKQYKVRITLKAGEGTTTVDSELVSREAPVAT
jgi:hypothetical protein